MCVCKCSCMIVSWLLNKNGKTHNHTERTNERRKKNCTLTPWHDMSANYPTESVKEFNNSHIVLASVCIHLLLVLVLPVCRFHFNIVSCSQQSIIPQRRNDKFDIGVSNACFVGASHQCSCRWALVLKWVLCVLCSLFFPSYFDGARYINIKTKERKRSKTETHT